MNDSPAKWAPPIAIVLVLMGLCAYVQGNWTERWRKIDTQQIRRWVQHLENIPLAIGDWQGVVGVGASEEEKKVAKFEGERPLHFRNSKTNQVVNVSLICGYGRYVSVHTPEKCYVAAGYVLGEQPRKHTLDLGNDKKAEFYTATFIKETPEGVERLRVMWAWNDGTGWDAPTWPKVTYARSPALYKMYLISSMPRHDSRIEDLGINEFALAFFPSLDKALADDPGSSVAGATDSREAGAAGGDSAGSEVAPAAEAGATEESTSR